MREANCVVKELAEKWERRSPVNNSWFLDVTDAVVSFNYTSTLEMLCEIPEGCSVLHIHGYRDHGDGLVFGYAKPKTLKRRRRDSRPYTDECYFADDVPDTYVEMQRELIYDFYLGWKKQLRMRELKAFLRTLGPIGRVVVLGHSMAPVDLPYMETIETCCTPSRWLISQYDGCPSRSSITDCSFVHKVEFFDGSRITNPPL